MKFLSSCSASFPSLLLSLGVLAVGGSIGRAAAQPDWWPWQPDEPAAPEWPADGILRRTLVLEDGDLVLQLAADTAAQTITVDMAHAGDPAWIAFAFSEDANMLGSTAVILEPDDGPDFPQIYRLSDKNLDLSGVTLQEFSLTDTAWTQTGTQTQMNFTKPLVQDGYPTVRLPEVNNFLYAVGETNALGYHAKRAALQVSFLEADDPTPAPTTPAPTTAAPAAAAVAPPTWDGGGNSNSDNTPAPVAADPADAEQEQLDCTLQGNVDLKGDGSVLLRSVIDPVGETVTVELEYAGVGWVGLAFAEPADNPPMVPNTAVIGLPADQVVAKHSLAERTEAGVTAVDDGAGTLTDWSIEQGNGVTVLRFTKPLVEAGEPDVAVGDNTIIWAVGLQNGNALAYHGFEGKGSAVVAISECLAAGATLAPAPAPVPEPPTAAAADDNAGGANTGADNTGDGAGVDLGDGRLQRTLELEDGDLQLTFTTDEAAGTVTVDATYADTVWIAVAFSEDAFMPGSVAVIGLPNSDSTALPQKYNLQSRTEAGVTLSDRQTLVGTPSLAQNATHTTMSFTKLLQEEGEPTLSLTEDNNILYAVGSSNELGVHAKRQAFPLNFANADGDIVFAEAPNKSLWKAHGICMALSWAILVPLAVGSSVIRELLPLPDGMWFQLHRGLNSLGVMLTIAGFGIAVKAFQDEGNDHFSVKTHHKIGLVVFIFAVVQALSGILRPHGPHQPDPEDGDREGQPSSKAPDDSAEAGESEGDDTPPSDDRPPAAEEKSTARTLWEYQHRILGTVTMILGWYNCDSGLEQYNIRFGGKNLEGALWGVIAGIAIVTLLGSLYINFVKKRRQ